MQNWIVTLVDFTHLYKSKIVQQHTDLIRPS